MLSSDDSSEEVKIEKEINASKPLATSRSRRANAGNLMGHIIQEVEDDFYNNIYGGFEDEDEDDDFEGDEKLANEGDDGDDSDASSRSESSSDDSESDTSSSNADEDQEIPIKMEPGDGQFTVKAKDTKPQLPAKARSKASPKSNASKSKVSNNRSNSSGKSRPSRSKKKEAQKTIAEFIKEEEQPEIKFQFKDYARFCSVCLSAQSDEDDEIIECDSCGVTVHESCYGVTGEETPNCEKISVNSQLSSDSTELWFCEPCKRSVRNPMCELCPNSGGIFKETDAGRWVHMVCALYTRGVTFENIHNLTDVSLFELNYSLFGSKTCTICEDRRLAKSGICIDCDAGLCKTFFHATCAQKEGLLFESQSDEVDPYFAQCKQHADKAVIKAKKRTHTALFARLNRTKPIEDLPEKIKQKLTEINKQPHQQRTRWTPDNPPPIPHKSSRMLLTSPSLIIKLTRKSEIMGLDPTSSFMLLQDETDMARQRWHIPPAFSLEFVAYCLDRSTRMISMKNSNSELIIQNSILKKEEASLREKYNSIKADVNSIKSENDAMIKEVRNIQKMIGTETGKQFNLPLPLEQTIARCLNTKQTAPPKAPKHSAAPPSATHECTKCNNTKDQHLLSLCDTCKCYFHIYCLDPPLTRVPKKNKFGGWQCSDCSEKEEEDQEEALEEQITLATLEAEGPRKLRERIKYPEKYCHESMLAANFWSGPPRRRSKKSSRSSHKKPKIETKVQ